MSALSCSDRVAQLAADPALVGHPVVAVEALERELAVSREENAELRRQLPRHRGNSGRPPSQDGPAAQVDVRVDHWPMRCGGCDAALPRPVQCGPRLEALAAYLRYAQHLSVVRLRALLRERHRVALLTGTVEALCRLAPEAAHQQRQALAVPVACRDEIGLRVAGKPSGCT